jgi:XTP/dITP diphosphohydrolase
LSEPRRTVVVATGNRGKLRELRELLSSLPIDLVSLADASAAPITIVEDGDTFEDNARKKATIVARALALPALADDSGLEVDALDGAPGVRSARYAGEGATDAENNRKLLAALDGVDRRAARFRCVLSFVDPIGQARFVASGTCEGAIARTPRGAGGFGYDPIFLVDGFDGRTLAELADAEKNAISHRARAVSEILAQLRDWLR